MHILIAIGLFLVGLAIGWLVGYLSKADPPAPYMELIPRVEQVGGALPGSEGEDRKRLCAEFQTLVDGLAAKGAPASIVQAGRDDIKTYCK